MLQTIRENTQGWIASVIIGIIILTFALWGIHSYFIGGGNNNIIAEVNGVNINKEQLSLAYERLRRQMQNSTNPLQNDVALKDQALQSLIELEVLKQASFAEGFRIYETQVDSYLQTIPDFQVDGQFSLDKFERVLSASMLSSAEFLNLIQTSLQIEQPKLGVIFTSFALPDETAANIGLINQERNVQYLTIPLSYFLNQPTTITPQQVQKYYQDNQRDYMTSAKVSVEYLELNASDLYASIHPTEAELKNYYNENISSYSVTSESNKEAKPQTFAAVQNKVRDSYIKQHADEKMADLREQLSNMTYEHPDTLSYAAKNLNLPIKTTDYFGKAGGDTGNDHGDKSIVQYKKVRDVAFSNDVLNLKNNSDVIQITPQSVIVLRVKSYLPSALVPLQSVEKQIEEKLKVKQAEEKADNFSITLSKKLQDGADPIDVANSFKFNWTNAGYIGRYNTKIDSAILDSAFNLPRPQKDKTIYAATKIPNGYAIVAVSGVKAGEIDDKKQYPIFAEQVQNSEGLLEYDLYRISKLKQAKVELTDS